MAVISGQASDELTRPIILAVYPAQLVELTARFGVSADELLRGTGMERASLDQPGAMVTPASVLALNARALELTREPGLGFYYGLQLKLSSHGLVGMLAMASATLRDAVSVLERFSPLRSPYVRFLHYVQDDEAVLELVDALPNRAERVFATEALFTMIVQVARTLLGRALTGRVELSYPQPEHYARFAHLWPGPARFDQPQSRLLFPASRLDDSLQMADSVTAKQIEQECERELEKRAQQDFLLSELMRQIRAHRDGFPGLEQMARERHVSERTLKRQLHARGTTYRALLDALKRERATELLERKNLSVQEVAHALGYGDPANFHRAFRRWFGVSPESWRRQRA